MITGKITNGFEFEVEEDLMDDYEFLETLCEIDNGNASLIPAVATRLLGVEQKKALMEHIRGENGRVSCRKWEKRLERSLLAVDKEKTPDPGTHD